MATSGTDGTAFLCLFEPHSVGQCFARGNIVSIFYVLIQCKNQVFNLI